MRCTVQCRDSRDRPDSNSAPPCPHSPRTACGRNDHSAEKPRQKQFSAPYRSGDRGTFAGCVIGNHTLVPLELAPGDITPPYMVPAVYRVEHAPVPSRLLGG